METASECGQHEVGAVPEQGFPLGELLYAYLGAFGVKKRRYRQVKLLAYALYLLEHLPVALVIAVGEVLSRYVHTAQHQLAQHLIVRC